MSLAIASSADSPEPHYELVVITPELALELLTKNTHNRTVRERVFPAYATDMAAGVWRENGESIKIAIDGTLLDGQHRLLAIVESETTHRMLVVSNLPPETQETIDGGAKRKFADVLRLRGETSYKDLASIVRRVTLWTAGQRKSGGNFAPTVSQMLTTLESNSDLRYSTQVALETKRQVQIPASVLGLCHWLTVRLEPDDCQWFFDHLKTGAGMSAAHPIMTLRRTARDRMTSKSRLTETMVTAYVIKAWNAYREGREIGHLRYRPGGAQPEPFPEPR